MKEQILRMIGLHNGIREVDLALAVMNVILPQHFDTNKYHETIRELINSSKIKKVDYVDSSITMKSIFFTQETKIIFGFDWSESGKMVGEGKGDT